MMMMMTNEKRKTAKVAMVAALDRRTPGACCPWNCKVLALRGDLHKTEKIRTFNGGASASVPSCLMTANAALL